MRLAIIGIVVTAICVVALWGPIRLLWSVWEIHEIEKDLPRGAHDDLG